MATEAAHTINRKALLVILFFVLVAVDHPARCFLLDRGGFLIP
jgi:hypothetical protein